MLELIIEQNDTKKRIGLVRDGIIEEYYEEDEKTNRNEGNIYIGIVRNVVKGMESAFVDIGTEKNSLIHLKDVLPKVDESKENQKSSNVKIEEVIENGKKLLVQVKKDSNEQKGARISAHINLPSKYIIFMPNTDIITISQKITDEKEQKRLIKLVKENISEGNGAVIRTAAEGKEKEIIDDIKYIENKWKGILHTSIDPKDKKAKLLYKSEDIVEKILIDYAGKGINKVIVNDKNEYERIEFLKKYNKEYDKLEVILDNKDLFNKCDLNNQIQKINNRKIWLKSGGFITIDKTEALTAIDVNTGKYIGTDDFEETVFNVNLEATIEIARQLRLKDIGGIIIIDYIDMNNEKDKEKIQKTLEEELKKDRSKTQVEGFTKLDLMEITRKHICSHKK